MRNILTKITVRAILSVTCILTWQFQSLAQCNSLTTIGSAYTQNFNTLSNTAGSTTNSLTIPGWYLTESGGGARDNEQYGVETGASTTGDMYSYGSAASTDRALGQLRSGTLIPLFGACFTNNTGTTITSLVISYTGEQWRFGGVHVTVGDKMDFQYSVNATDLVTGTWLDANALDFLPPVTAGIAGALDGNAAANRTAISSTITGLSIPPGATFWIRWNDVDATGADDGLAIDDLSLTPNSAGCPAITVTVPSQNTGMVGVPYNQSFNASGGQTAYNFTVSAGTVPTGLTLSPSGVLSGTPTANGTFNFTTTATDANLCTGSNAFTINIAVAAPNMSASLRDALLVDANGNNIANPNDQIRYTNTIRNTGSIDATGVNFTDTAAYYTTLNAGTNPVTSALARDDAFSTPANTVLNIGNLLTNDFGVPGKAIASFGTTASLGTTTSAGSAGTTDGGGTLTVNADGSINYNPPANFVGTDKFMYIATTVPSGGILPNNDAVVTITVTCQTITITNPAVTSGTAGTPFSQTFTQTGAIGGATFTTASTLPAGLTLSTAGVLNGTPTQAGSFPIVVTVTDGNGCTGTGPTYTLVIGCQTITVTNPAVASGTVGAAFSQTFTQTGAIGGATFTTASTLPAGLSLSTAGVLSGTATQTGSFPIVITVTDGNGCTGTGATYTLVIVCQTITITNPGVTSGTAGTAFSQTFTQTAAIGGSTFTTASTLPAGLTLSTAGVLSGTATQVGSFPIVVTVTDGNGCTGTGATYTLVIVCQVITVTNPGVTTGIYQTAFSKTFTQTGAIGGATFTTASTLPAGLSLSTSGVLSGTPTQTGSFPIVVTVTDGNGCSGTGATYNLAVAPNLQGDAYANVVGNTQLVAGGLAPPSTPPTYNATNILTNDQSDVTITITAVTNAATVGGGQITIDALGKFTYSPPVGSVAADSYAYTGTANGVSATATINFTFGVGMIWYVNNTYAGANGAANGQSHRPYVDVASAETASGNGDYIYVYTGNTTGAAVLKPGQILRGAGSALSVGALTIPAGTKPTLTGTITLANNITADGFDMNTAATTAITSSGATGVNVAIGTVTVNGAASAITLTNTTGTISNTGGTLTGGAGGPVFNVSGGTATITNAAKIVQTLANSAITITSATGGTISFSGSVSSTGTSTGIDLTNNSGATINFTNALTLSTGANPAFTATGGGTISATGSGSTIATTTGTALNVANTTIGASGFTFNRISSNGAARGIILNNTGAGGLTVTGTGGSGLCDVSHIGASDCGGGSILNSTVRGAEFSNANNISLKNMYFKGNGTTAVACVDDVSVGSDAACNAAIHITSCGNVTLDHIYVDGTGSNDMGILGNNVNTLTATNVEVANFSNIVKTPVVLQNLSGTCPFTSLNVHNNNTIHGVFVTQNTGTSNITFTSPVLTNNSGTNNPDQIQVDSYGSANVTVSATNVNISSGSLNTGNGVMFQANSGSTMNATLNGGTVTGTNGILMQSAGDNTHFTYNVTNLTNVSTHNLGSNAITVGKANGAGTATTTGSVTNNVITSATCGGGCAGIHVASFGAGGSSTAIVTGNNISGVDAQGIWVVGGQGSSNLTATVQNNNLHNPVAGNTSYAIDAYPGTQAGDAVCFAVNLGDMTSGHTVPGNRNLITGSWQSGGNPIEVGIFNNSTFKLLNYPSPNTSDVNAAAWVSASNGGLGTDAFHLGANQFIAGAACPLLLGKGGIRSSNRLNHTSANISYSLSEAQLRTVVNEALVIWESQGLDNEQIKKLHQIQFSIGNLEEGQLANKAELGVVISYNADGKGWCIGADAGHIDLLTCILHEVGHILGYKDLHGKKYRSNIMYEKLSVGERRLPGGIRNKE